MFLVKQKLDKISRFGLVLKMFFLLLWKTDFDKSKELTPLLSTVSKGRQPKCGKIVLVKGKKRTGI